MKYSWKDTEHYVKIYDSNPNYGSDQRHFTNYLVSLMDEYHVSSFFDFGCGLNHVVINACRAKKPAVKYFGYDPAVQDFQCNEVLHNHIPPEMTADMLVSSDCLEHIHENELFQVWDIFKKLCPRIMYHTISTRLAGQLLSDGTNAHKTVRPDNWWFGVFTENFSSYELVNLTTERNKQNNVATFLAVRQA